MSKPTIQSTQRRRLFALLLVLAAILFAVALSRSAYDLTSPDTLPFHLFVRKAYSIVAFAILGYLFGEMRAEAGRPVRPLVGGGVVGLFSLCIEIAQHFAGSQEGHRSNLADVEFGIIGGAIGAAIALVRRGLTV